MNPDSGLNQDFLDILHAFADEGVEFLIVGAHALAAHGIPRATGDLDLWVRPSLSNASRVVAALTRFGAPLAMHGVSAQDFAKPGAVYQIGLPPRRIDLLTEISGVEFEHAWASRITVGVSGRPVGFLGREALITNKRTAGRDKDLVDLKMLEAKGGG